MTHGIQLNDINFSSGIPTSKVITQQSWSTWSAVARGTGANPSSNSAAHDLIRLDSVRGNPLYAGIDGAGTTVVVIDTGADLDHPAYGPDADGNGIADRILFQYDFNEENDANASDGHGHGTHVMGIVGSQNPTYPGVAPGVNFIVLKIGSDTDGSAPIVDMEEAWQWVVENGSAYNIVAVNMSFGISNTYYDSEVFNELSDEIQTLAEAGIASVIAAGNDYDHAPGVNYLSASPYAWSIASTLSTENAFSAFSQRSTTMSDLAAPGSNIMSSTLDGNYGMMSGTSMATPMVSGLVALAQDLSQEITGGQKIPVMVLLDLMRAAGVPIVDDIAAVPRIDTLNTLDAIVAFYRKSTNGDDTIWGWRGNDALFGLNGQDIIRGHDGNDTLNGGTGIDVLEGDAGADRIFGGTGKDILRGDRGKDAFVFNTTLNRTSNVDRIVDFSVADDSLYLDNAVFRKTGTGTLSHPKPIASDMFTSGKNARDAEDRIVYDKAKGALYYDADGTGSSRQVLFATVSKNLKMSYHDVFIV